MARTSNNALARTSNNALARTSNNALTGMGVWVSLLGLAACGGEADPASGGTGQGFEDVPALSGTAGDVPPAAPVGAVAGAPAAAPTTPTDPGGAGAPAPTEPANGEPTPTDPAMDEPIPTDPASGEPAPTDPVAGGEPTDPADTPAGPEAGDPNAPVFSIPEVDCGGPAGFFGGANFDIGGREMIVTYPCNRRAGAPMTFFLNLHGTTPVEQHFYQHGYFSIHQYTESHNIIVVTPSSVVEQWGNGDGGQDEPHLMEIIDWVYATFDGDGAFDIRGMWVGGHSWGAMYTTTFACKAELADRVVGAVLMSGIGRNPACASDISVISTAAENDIGPVVDQGNVPSSHGCGAPEMNMITNNEETYWPDCDPGFTHANYFMLGKQHASSIDAEVVERIADLINLARL